MTFTEVRRNTADLINQIATSALFATILYPSNDDSIPRLQCGRHMSPLLTFADSEVAHLTHSM